MTPDLPGLFTTFRNRRAPNGSLARDNFAKWFGASKAMELDGTPFQVHHGTDQKFSTFSKNMLGSASGSSDSKQGFWFSSDYARAQDAAGDAKMTNGTCESWVMSVFLRIENPFFVQEPIRSFDPSESAKLIRRAKFDGHDGVIFVEGEGHGSDFVVFEPSQIKSATDNSGAFNPDSDSITDTDRIIDSKNIPRNRMRP